MADINDCSFTGRLSSDAEKKTLPTGTQLVTFSMANNRGWGDKQKTLWLTVNIWGKTGENLYKYLTKGKLVGVSGELELNKYVSKVDGLEHTKLILNSRDVILMSSNKPENKAEISYEYVDGDPIEDVEPIF